MSNYQLGAVVYLRSGSPRMTIVRLFDAEADKDGVVVSMAEVAYAAYGEHHVVRHEFPLQALDVKSLPPAALLPAPKSTEEKETETP